MRSAGLGSLTTRKEPACRKTTITAIPSSAMTSSRFNMTVLILSEGLLLGGVAPTRLDGVRLTTTRQGSLARCDHGAGSLACGYPESSSCTLLGHVLSEAERRRRRHAPRVLRIRQQVGEQLRVNPIRLQPNSHVLGNVQVDPATNSVEPYPFRSAHAGSQQARGDQFYDRVLWVHLHGLVHGPDIRVNEQRHPLEPAIVELRTTGDGKGVRMVRRINRVSRR